jgi:hypothetical protein
VALFRGLAHGAIITVEIAVIGRTSAAHSGPSLTDRFLRTPVVATGGANAARP